MLTCKRHSNTRLKKLKFAGASQITESRRRSGGCRGVESIAHHPHCIAALPAAALAQVGCPTHPATPRTLSPGGESPGQQGALGGGALYLSIIAALLRVFVDPTLHCLQHMLVLPAAEAPLLRASCLASDENATFRNDTAIPRCNSSAVGTSDSRDSCYSPIQDILSPGMSVVETTTS